MAVTPTSVTTELVERLAEEGDIMKTIYAADPVRFRHMITAEVRENFLIDSLFEAGIIEMVYSHIDRVIVGSAVPMTEPLRLATADELRADYFAQRRELGVLNLGAEGRITVDGTEYQMAKRDGLYIRRGSREISFESADATDPAAFYLLSYPAHTTYPTTQARQAEAEAVHLGSDRDANRRTIYKYIHPAGIQSCQLVMGFTELAPGSVWNTMPAHLHPRRMEVYLYFDLDESHRVFHLMGSPDETRHIVVANRQAVLSPSWSIHAGCGTNNYCFCWGMGGENQEFDDMDPVGTETLR